MHNLNILWDSRNGYGLISRTFHWLMVILFLWQFTSAILRFFAKGTAVYNFFWSTHYQLGFTLLVLVLFRGVWALLNRSRRPQKVGLIGKLAVLGQFMIYILTLAVPILALLHSYGSGNGFWVFGFQIFEQTNIKNTALIALGNILHGLFGWVLMALIVGHIFMVFIHHFVLSDDTLRYMAGRRLKD